MLRDQFLLLRAQNIQLSEQVKHPRNNVNTNTINTSNSTKSSSNITMKSLLDMYVHESSGVEDVTKVIIM